MAIERGALDDWKTLRPSKRHVNTVTGEELSDRQFRQRFLYAGRTLETVQHERGAPLANYNRLVRARQRYLASHGITANLREVRQSSDMQQIIKTLKRHTREHQKVMRALDKDNRERAKRGLPEKHLTAAQKRALFGPQSELAQALADVGYRDHDARHYVGDS